MASQSCNIHSTFDYLLVTIPAINRIGFNIVSTISEMLVQFPSSRTRFILHLSRQPFIAPYIRVVVRLSGAFALSA
jgi:hypothetical protein